jgi:hypothetical protein
MFSNATVLKVPLSLPTTAANTKKLKFDTPTSIAQLGIPRRSAPTTPRRLYSSAILTADTTG